MAHITTTDTYLNDARGASGLATVQKFGRNPSVASATEETIWFGGGIYTGWLQAAEAVRIQAGGNVNDTAAGSGAQSVIVVGLDENWADATEEIATNGSSASSATTVTFIRVFRAYIVNVGTYGGGNTGDIVLETTGATVVAAIEATLGQSQLALYTIPDTYTGYLRRIGATVEGSKTADVYFFQRQNADDVSTPFTGRRLIHALAKLTGPFSLSFKSYKGPFPARTDIWASAVGPSGGSAVSAAFDVVLVPD